MTKLSPSEQMGVSSWNFAGTVGNWFFSFFLVVLQSCRKNWRLSLPNLERASLRMNLTQRKEELKKTEGTGPWWPCLDTEVQWCSESRGAWTFQFIMLINLLLLNRIWIGFLLVYYSSYCSHHQRKFDWGHVHHYQPYWLLINCGFWGHRKYLAPEMFQILLWGERGGDERSVNKTVQGTVA